MTGLAEETERTEQTEQTEQRQGAGPEGAGAGPPGADCPLADAARDALRHAGYAPLGRLSVTTTGGTVVLTGTVRSYYHKQLAQEAVLGLPGVEAVRNEVRVASD